MRSTKRRKGPFHLRNGPFFGARRTGLEPAASGVTGRRYNRLNYRRNEVASSSIRVGPGKNEMHGLSTSCTFGPFTERTFGRSHPSSVHFMLQRMTTLVAPNTMPRPSQGRANPLGPRAGSLPARPRSPGLVRESAPQGPARQLSLHQTALTRVR
jgi:hypothetical protein